MDRRCDGTTGQTDRDMSSPASRASEQSRGGTGHALRCCGLTLRAPIAETREPSRNGLELLAGACYEAIQDALGEGQESRPELDALDCALRDECQPVGVLGKMLVERIA